MACVCERERRARKPPSPMYNGPMASRHLFEMGTWMASIGFLAIFRQFVPKEYIDYIRRSIRRVLRSLMPYVYCDIHEYNRFISNSLYRDVEIYLSSLTFEGADRVNVCKSRSSKSATFSMANNQRIVDTFDKANVQWVHRISERPAAIGGMPYDTRASDEKRMFTLQLSKKDKERMFEAYVKHIEAKARDLKREARDLLLYTNSRGFRPWESVPFLHPANFDTIAMDGDLKSKIMTDLDHFAANEMYYRKVGKAWKRGYLLFGPPGTGKSSMIAAIANRMKYDVYDLELTEVKSNSELRKLLIQTSNKSIIVVEDIDCSLDLSGQRKGKDSTTKKKEKSSGPKAPESKVSLSGLLNFVDGLWSSCGSERIFIFTTNYPEKLDPALLRAGRMDMHIHLTYCTFSAFKILSKNYLDLTEHELFENLKVAFEGSYMSPAEVSEVLLQNQHENPTIRLERLIVTLGEHREDPKIKAEKAAALKDEEETAATTSKDEEDDDETSSKENEDRKAKYQAKPKAPQTPPPRRKSDQAKLKSSTTPGPKQKSGEEIIESSWQKLDQSNVLPKIVEPVKEIRPTSQMHHRMQKGQSDTIVEL